MQIKLAFTSTFIFFSLKPYPMVTLSTCMFYHVILELFAEKGESNPKKLARIPLKSFSTARLDDGNGMF